MQLKALRHIIGLVGAAMLAASMTSAQSPADRPEPLTEIEGLRVQNLNLRRALLDRDIADFQRALRDVEAAIEAKRPGWDWQPESGQWVKLLPAEPTR